ncbi:MAG: ABC transporter ATP-binding protein, partial [Woeseia sp.]|nr:ABC transporter ATP-binding protein [Woeseia sp.]NNL54247.1 ABC transporter ATP-binding protein [Woeseia sp.]
MQIALEARHLRKQYPGVLAVEDVSFSVPEGICFGLLGPNGAGKTTTVEIIEGVTPATAGEVYYFGNLAGRRFREEAGIQFQDTALQDHLTVRETLELFQNLYDRRADIDHIISECSLGDLQRRDNRKLSGGQRQRLLLAVALVNQPRLVFLDEPTTGLDPQARRNFWDLVRRIKADGTT